MIIVLYRSFWPDVMFLVFDDSFLWFQVVSTWKGINQTSQSVWICKWIGLLIHWLVQSQNDHNHGNVLEDAGLQWPYFWSPSGVTCIFTFWNIKDSFPGKKNCHLMHARTWTKLKRSTSFCTVYCLIQCLSQGNVLFPLWLDRSLFVISFVLP